MESLLQCRVTQRTVSGFWTRSSRVCLAVTINFQLYVGQFQDAADRECLLSIIVIIKLKTYIS